MSTNAQPIIKEEPALHVFRDIHSCNMCQYKTRSTSLINSHLQRHREEYTPQSFSCVDSIPELYKCHSCDYETCLFVNIKEHDEKTHNPDPEIKTEYKVMRIYNCKNCNFETWSHLMFLRHNYDACLLNQDFKNNPIKQFNLVQTVDLDTEKTYVKNNVIKPKFLKNYACGNCNLETGSRPLFLKHFKTECSVKKTDLMKWFKCGQCPYTTTWGSSLRRHLLAKHTDPANIIWFKCELCPYKAQHQYKVNQHVQRKHTASEDIKWFECHQCFFKSKQRYHLKSHIEAKHTASKNIKWFKCDHCCYKTKHKSSLKPHILTQHTADVKWFQCKHCKFRTKQEPSLKYHVQLKHAVSADIKWFRCEYCGYRVKQETTLKNHIMKQHNSAYVKIKNYRYFECEQCSHKTKWKRNLTRHVQRRHMACKDVK